MTEQGEYGVGSKPGVDVDNHEFVQWARRMFNQIAVGGKWAVPRSGLIFEKRSETQLVLVALADEYDLFRGEDGNNYTPLPSEMVDPVKDYAIIRAYMTLAGVDVSNETTLGDE